MVSRVYPTMYDHVTQHKYRVFTSPYYNAYTPFCHRDGTLIDPIYVPMGGEQVYALVTIEQLIDIRARRLPFQLCDPHKVIEIYHAVVDYLVELRPALEKGEPISTEYVTKYVAPFYTEIGKLLKRTLRANKTWKRDYYGEQEGSVRAMLETLKPISQADLAEISKTTVSLIPIDRLIKAQDPNNYNAMALYANPNQTQQQKPTHNAPPTTALAPSEFRFNG